VPCRTGRKDGPKSHHLDTPLASQNGQLYRDDLYVFERNDSTVLIMDVNSSITGGQQRRADFPYVVPE
jgi:hypothetical protein